MKIFISSVQKEFAAERKALAAYLSGPFDATFCRNASLDDLDEDKITRFLVLSRRGRNSHCRGIRRQMKYWCISTC